MYVNLATLALFVEFTGSQLETIGGHCEDLGYGLFEVLIKDAHHSQLVLLLTFPPPTLVEFGERAFNRFGNVSGKTAVAYSTTAGAELAHQVVELICVFLRDHRQPAAAESRRSRGYIEVHVRSPECEDL